MLRFSNAKIPALVLNVRPVQMSLLSNTRHRTIEVETTTFKQLRLAAEWINYIFVQRYVSADVRGSRAEIGFIFFAIIL